MPRINGVQPIKVLGTVGLAGTLLLTGNAVQAANTAQAAPAGTTISTHTGTPAYSSLRKRKKQKFFRKCKRSRRFNERQVRFGTNAILAGRCITSKRRGVKSVGSYRGHQPSAGRAIDVMINKSGSCRAGRKAGYRVARYFLKKSRRHRVLYIIWANKIWGSYESRKRIGKWRKMHRRGSCTTRHYDHVHISFK